MKVSYDVVIKSGDQEVDMEYGLDTLSGTAEVTCILAEAILRKKLLSAALMLTLRERFSNKALKVLMVKTST
ncbi:hypothetical protein OIU82_06430 [Escherichia coli]|nr:hypothetical protein [Escherichia coli]